MSSFRRSKNKSLTNGKSKGLKSMLESGYEVFVHGYILIQIRSARHLPDMDSWLSKLVDKNDVTDAFIDVSIGRAKLIKSSVIDNDLNPVWNESYRVEVCHLGTFLTFKIRDKDHTHSQIIGSVNILLSTLLSGSPIEGWFPIMKTDHVQCKNAELDLQITYVPRTSLRSSYEVDCYFPVRKNCLVTLYQDAHSLNVEKMPHFNMMSPPHQPRSCWKDLHDAIVEAKHVICITGWGFLPRLKLNRDADSKIQENSLGDLLINRAEEGVKVYIMIWDERSSNCIVGETGFMGNNDEATFKFFKDTKVNCILTPRVMSVNEFTDVLNNQFSSSFYSHHQKSVVCDFGGSDEHTRRRLIAFVGGLDLTQGRYDTPNHELFSTLLHEHDGDFRNSDVKSIPPRQGPREPWHDIHSKLEGSIAYDIFLNFQERWIKQGNRSCTLDDIDCTVIDIDWSPDSEECEKQWSCQLFRSITSDSVNFTQRSSDKLNKKKGRLIDSSIAQAYVQMIRNAENFLYIENQYFLGSAYSWIENSDVNCHHTIPSEIAQKIVDKICSNERFVAYIVIPMFPNGNPASAVVQQVLFYQYKTMQMMYKKVADAIKYSGSNTRPTDWLVFMCLGKRESAGPHLDKLDEATETMAKVLRQTLRFPIYVHSKMMIVDDFYILLGSANINERSMAGSRDTEMAVGCWQPAYDVETPSGDVHRFRMSLWVEHFRYCHPLMNDPASLECVRKVKEIADHNWQMYVGPMGSSTPGHFLTYPLEVTEGGDLQCLEDLHSFPDFSESSKIVGTMSSFIPQKLTT